MTESVTVALELLPWPTLSAVVGVVARPESTALAGLVVPGDSAVARPIPFPSPEETP